MCPVTFDEVLNSAKEHFHEDCLRAYPATEQSTVDDRKENNEYHPDDQRKGKQKHILRPEYLAKNEHLFNRFQAVCR